MKSNLKIAVILVFLASEGLATSGCSVFMAAKQPGKKDLSVFDPGTPRDNVIGELGTPKWSEEENGKKVDIFTFVQGYSTGVKTGRALAHGAADFFTLGLWEFVGTPTEAIFDGAEMKVKVVYDEADRVESFEYLNQPTKAEPKKEADVESFKEDNSVTDQDFGK